ncbi:MAG: squalene/phytoene synthase family protein [Paracoccaceae bacterium]
MSVAACAALVERGDPDRFAATLAAPAARRGDLFTLYAYNLELARAPWVASAPLIAEMRLQWWRDVLVAPQPPAHEVAGPLHGLIARAGLPVTLLDEMAAARRWDISDQPFADVGGLVDYVGQTSGHLMWLAALCLGAPAQSEAALRQIALGAGIAGFLRAAAELSARGRRPLSD